MKFLFIKNKHFFCFLMLFFLTSIFSALNVFFIFKKGYDTCGGGGFGFLDFYLLALPLWLILKDNVNYYVIVYLAKLILFYSLSIPFIAKWRLISLIILYAILNIISIIFPMCF